MSNMHYDSDTLDDYLHGALGPERDAKIHAHLERCAECRALYDDNASLSDWVRTNAQAEEREFPSMIKARVWESVRRAETRPSFVERLRSLWRPAIAVPVAAALAAIVYLGVPAVHGGGQSTIAAPATYLLQEHSALAAENPLADHSLIVPASMVDGTQPAGLISADNAPDAER